MSRSILRERDGEGENRPGGEDDLQGSHAAKSFLEARYTDRGQDDIHNRSEREEEADLVDLSRFILVELCEEGRLDVQVTQGRHSERRYKCRR